jgi:hypothetical protein
MYIYSSPPLWLKLAADGCSWTFRLWEGLFTFCDVPSEGTQSMNFLHIYSVPNIDSFVSFSNPWRFHLWLCYHILGPKLGEAAFAAFFKVWTRLHLIIVVYGLFSVLQLLVSFSCSYHYCLQFICYSKKKTHVRIKSLVPVLHAIQYN